MGLYFLRHGQRRKIFTCTTTVHFASCLPRNGELDFHR
jgi:hypothetical protein